MKQRGKTSIGTQRWECLRCRITFVRKDPSKRLERGRVWFERWMRNGWSISELMEASGHGRWKTQGLLHEWLKQPSPPPQGLSAVRHLALDGTYLKGRDAIFITMDGEKNDVVAGEHGIKEGSKKMREFLLGLARDGLNPVSITIDGNTKVLAAIRALWPKAVMQRCLVHVQRQGLMWCRMKPKRTDAKRLREIFLRVMSISTKKDRDTFLSDVKRWDASYGAKIKRKGKKAWVSSDLWRARIMLLNALPDMFRYLEDPHIPKTTNCVEGYFSRMKGIYRLHRGLAKDRRRDYFRWHFHLNRR